MKVARINGRVVPEITANGGIGGTTPVGVDDEEWTTNPTDLALGDLTDVDTTGVVDGDVIVFDEYSGLWVPGSGGGALSDATPLVESGAGDSGVGTEASRDDHVHPVSDVTLDAIPLAVADVSLNTNKITDLVDPTNDQDAATKKYVDDNSVIIDTSDYVRGASGSGAITIPGLASSPDRVPTSPSASDDEFDGSNSFSSVLGSLNTNNVSDRASNLHLAKTSAASAIHGVYKACPSIPFTMTAQIIATDIHLNFQQAGIFVAEASPGKLYVLGPIAVNSAITMNANIWTNNTTRSTVYDTGTSARVEGYSANAYKYIRLVVASSTDISAFWSQQGITWYAAKANADPGFTVGSVGLFVGAPASTQSCEAYFDWVRFE